MTSFLVETKDVGALEDELQPDARLRVVFRGGLAAFEGDIPAGRISSGTVLDGEAVKLLDPERRIAALAWRQAQTIAFSKVPRFASGKNDRPKPIPPVRSRALDGNQAIGLVFAHDERHTLSASEIDNARAQMVAAALVLARAAPVRLVFHIAFENASSISAQAERATEDVFERSESVWRDAALLQLGGSFIGASAAGRYASSLCTATGAKVALPVFFTAFPSPEAAYFRKDYVVVTRDVEAEVLHWTFAHEICHRFGAKDEFGTKGEPCLMRNTVADICDATRVEIGWG